MTDAENEVTGRYITETLPPEACRQVQNLILAERGHQLTEHCGLGSRNIRVRLGTRGNFLLRVEPATYTMAEAKDVWNRTTFSHCTTFQHLWLYIPPEERCFGNEFGIGSNWVRSRSACAWAMQQLQKCGFSRRRLPVRNWPIVTIENKSQVSEPKSEGCFKPTVMRVATIDRYAREWAWF